jgi:RimJ/RimL family protein N-acetyltransferase
MQQSWRTDTDKLTFILCLPPAQPHDHTAEIMAMIGDVNMFLSIHEEENGRTSLVGELELMVALKTFQRRGYGRAALLTFLYYILDHEFEIVHEFTGKDFRHTNIGKFDCLIAKIKEENERSLQLFESVGFERASAVPNFFGEFELKHCGLSIDAVRKMMSDHDIEQYQEGKYAEAIA